MAGLTLRLLGSTKGTDQAGAPLLLPTKKSWALLSYLALHPGQNLGRESLATLLWGSRPDHQARGNLRQTIYELRNALGAAADACIDSSKDGIALRADQVDVDVMRFETAAASADPDHLAEAEALYRGPLLDGLETGEEGFDTWLEAERTRLHDRACQVLVRLADRHIDSGAYVNALESARRLLRLDPLSEAGHRTLMRALAASGRRNDALKHFQALQTLLKSELGAEPDSETVALHAAIQRGESAPKGPAFSRVGAKADEAAMSFPLPDKPSIAVMPFDNLTGVADQEYLADGFTENIITELSRDRALFVIARHSTYVYKGKPVGIAEVAEQLGVRYVLEGSVQRDSKRFRVSVQLIDATSGDHVWSERYDARDTQVFAVQDEIVRRIVATLRGYKGPIQRAELDRSFAKPPASLSAYESLMRGMMHKERFRREDNEIARRYFESAIEQDPKFAAAYGWLAWTYFFDVYMGWGVDPAASLAETFTLARRSVQLDPDLDFAHWALGAAYLASGDHAKALSEFDRALELNPNNSDVLANTAWPYAFRGEPETAISNMERAMRLNPHHPDWYWWGLGIAYFAAGRHAEAARALERVTQQNSESLAYLVASYTALGKLQLAEAKKQELLRLEPDFSLTHFAATLTFETEDAPQRLLSGLRAAGLPDVPPKSP